MRKAILGIVVFCGLWHLSVSAEPWQRYKNKDEMRGTVTHAATIKASTIGGGSTTLDIHVFDKSPEGQGVYFLLSGDKVLCDQQVCEFDVRFGEGSVKKVAMIVDGDKKSIFPQESTSFAGAIGLVSTFYIELPVSSGASKQFKFEVDEPPFDRVVSPSFSIANIPIGGSPEKILPGFNPVKSAEWMDCREKKDVTGIIPNLSIKSVKLCFYKNRLYMAFIETAGRSQTEALSKEISRAYGPKGTIGSIWKWPEESGKMLDVNSTAASFWPDSKIKGAGLFMVSDEALSLTIP